MGKRLSLTTRLTLFFTLAAATVVTALGCLFIAAASQHFMELDRETLEDKQALIRETLDSASSIQEARQRLRESLNHHHSLSVLIKSVGGEEVLQIGDFFQSKEPIEMKNHADGGSLNLLTKGAKRLHAIDFKAMLKRSDEPSYIVTMGVDTKHHDHFLTELAFRLLKYGTLVTLMSGLLGWFAAHQGLAPLRAMKKRAATVTGQKMQERMQAEEVPIEMADLANELNQMLDRLQSDFERLSEFSSDLAHEFRTPISNLLTQTQVTLSAKRDDITYRETLASNAEEFQRMARMISDMLLLAKTEQVVELPNRECFDVASEAQALLEFYEAVAEEKSVVLKVEGEGRIQGDRLMFRRALSNLLSNALRYSGRGGQIRVVIAQDLKFTTVCVDNTGKTIDPTLLPRLFDRFYRADPSRSQPDSDGTGLGLAITRAIVQAHGGDVTVNSTDGKTRFCLTFPQQ